MSNTLAHFAASPKISDDDLVTFQGQVVAICYETGRPIVGEQNYEALDSCMAKEHPGIDYIPLCLPNLTPDQAAFREEQLVNVK